MDQTNSDQYLGHLIKGKLRFLIPHLIPHWISDKFAGDLVLA
jgi:hypothetical protein